MKLASFADKSPLIIIPLSFKITPSTVTPFADVFSFIVFTLNIPSMEVFPLLSTANSVGSFPFPTFREITLFICLEPDIIPTEPILYVPAITVPPVVKEPWTLPSFKITPSTVTPFADVFSFIVFTLNIPSIEVFPLLSTANSVGSFPFPTFREITLFICLEPDIIPTEPILYVPAITVPPVVKEPWTLPVTLPVTLPTNSPIKLPPVVKKLTPLTSINFALTPLISPVKAAPFKLALVDKELVTVVA